MSILNRRCLQMLDAQMVSVDAVDEYGNTVLIVAAQNNNKKIVKVRKESLRIVHRCRRRRHQYHLSPL